MEEDEEYQDLVERIVIGAMNSICDQFGINKIWETNFFLLSGLAKVGPVIDRHYRNNFCFSYF